MSIRMPKPSAIDRILRIFGKRRRVIIPVGAYENYGPYVCARGYKESIWAAIFRKKSAQLPFNFIDIFQANDFFHQIQSSKHRPYLKR